VTHSNTSFLHRGRERRKFVRAPADFEIWVRNTTHFAEANMQSQEGLGVPCNLSDLSFGGARIVGTMSPGSLKDRLELALPTKNGGAISVIGTIVRSEEDKNEHAASVHFALISAEDQMKLTRVLADLGVPSERRLSACRHSSNSEVAIRRYESLRARRV